MHKYIKTIFSIFSILFIILIFIISFIKFDYLVPGIITKNNELIKVIMSANEYKKISNRKQIKFNLYNKSISSNIVNVEKVAEQVIIEINSTFYLEKEYEKINIFIDNYTLIHRI